MSKPKSIFTESTEVPVMKSISEIMGLLVQAGTGWMIVQRAEPAPVPEKKLARDGKMLATGEEA
jgi:hypothetical protein